MLANTLLTLALSQLSFAHFILEYPISAGFDDDVDGTAPCGGQAVNFTSSSSNVTVDRFAVALYSTHPQAEWLYRATLSSEAPYNWTNILPVVDQTSIGAFCLSDLSVPSEFAGQQGIIQVMQDAADGVLYQVSPPRLSIPVFQANVYRQCAPVNFITGSNSTVGSACTNATGLTATVTDQQAFSNTSDPSATSSMAGTTMTGAPVTASATSSAAAAAATLSMSSYIAGVGALLYGLAL